MCFYGLGGVGMPEWWERVLVQAVKGRRKGGRGCSWRFDVVRDATTHEAMVI